MLEVMHMSREERLAEGGTLAACPMCGVLRVQRSDYIRCNPCGVNWLAGENLDAHPKIERFRKLMASLKPLTGPKSQRGSETSTAKTEE